MTITASDTHSECIGKTMCPNEVDTTTLTAPNSCFPPCSTNLGGCWYRTIDKADHWSTWCECNNPAPTASTDQYLNIEHQIVCSRNMCPNQVGQADPYFMATKQLLGMVGLESTAVPKCNAANDWPEEFASISELTYRKTWTDELPKCHLPTPGRCPGPNPMETDTWVQSLRPWKSGDIVP